MKKFGLIILFLVFLVSTTIKIISVSGNNFPFTMDQGRDMVDIRQMVVSHTPRLVGPTTSINGVLLGPFWYYFLLPPFLVSGGSPQVVMYWQIIWYQLSVLFLWWVLKKLNKNIAFIAAFLLLLSPTGFYTGRYFWNANAMPLMTAFYFGVLLLTIKKPSTLNLILTGLVAGLSMQIEAAFGILFFPFAFLYLGILNKKLRFLLHLTFGFVITLIPQALFELRHQFIMTKVFVSEFSGKAAILGEKMTLDKRLTERWESLVDQIKNLSHIPQNYIYLIFFLSISLIIFQIIKSNKKTIGDNASFVSILFFVFSAIFYIVFPQQLKQWYVLGISIPLTLILAGAFAYLWETKNKINKVIVIGILIFHFTNAIFAQTDHIKNNVLKPSNDPSNLRNLITVIDTVYKEANGGAFRAFNYVPSVYDYSLNYLYWWYGTKTYGYQPSEVAYLPNQPEYIPGTKLHWTKTKKASNTDPTMLIIETDKGNPAREQAWLGNFSKLCLTKEVKFPWNSEFKVLGLCKK